MSSKICIVSTANIKHMTLISIYTTLLEKKGIEYDLIYLDRYGIDEETTATNIYKYTTVSDKNTHKFFKLRRFLNFRKYATKILRNNNYDLIIVWNTLTSLLLYNFLLKNKKKYILNIRDYYHEKNPLIYRLHKKLIENSLITTISSQGFRSFLPDHDYIFVNSLNEKIIDINSKTINEFNGIVNIGFLGNIRFYDQQIKLIEGLKNDSRFNLIYSGTNSEPLKQYVVNNSIDNCFFTGEFSPSETIEILSNFDIINNVFGNKSIAVQTLTSIRLYYSTIYKIPMLVSDKTHMSNIIDSFGLGFSIDLDSNNLADTIYNYFTKLEIEEYRNNTSLFNKKVQRENQDFKNKFNNIVSAL
ncbi:hypothetical protein [Aerococcus urinaeequi]|uniref:hypothetical protein n=1 Tax=Aerococcus urinaeequi TaxID=51665 RepID=UPI003AAAE637